MVRACHFKHYSHHKLWKGVLAGSIVIASYLFTSCLLFPDILPEYFNKKEFVGSYEISPSPINITSNADFDTSPGVRSGAGESGNPYIITEWEFDSSSSATAINIQNTNKYVVVSLIKVFGDYTGYGIRLSNATHVTIQHVLIENVSSGITVLSMCSDVSMNNVTISSVGTAVRINANIVQGNQINVSSSSGIGIDITGTSTFINDTDVHHCGSIGIRSTGSFTVVNNSRFFNNTGDAIYMTSSGNKVLNSNFTRNFAYGVRLQGSNCLVRNLIAKFTTLEHIFLDGSGASNNNVSFNTFVNSTSQSSILIQNAPDNLVNNNSITNLNGSSSNPDGILVTGSTGLRNNLINNTISVNRTGVVFSSGASQNKVEKNQFIRAATDVLIQSAGANDVLDNSIIASNSVALQVLASTGVRFSGNNVSESGSSLVLLIDIQNSPNTIIENNAIVGGFTAIAISSSSGVHVIGNQISGFTNCGIHAMPGSSLMNVSLNHLFQSLTGTGVWIETSGNLIARNNITALFNGIDISNENATKTGNVIRGNFIELNLGTGLKIDANTSLSQVYDNVFNNPAGFNVQNANATNQFYNVMMGTKNILNGPNTGGNYWHNYTSSIDSDLDGFGDLPYTQTNVTDSNPLVVLPVVNSPHDADYYEGLPNYRIPWIISASRSVSSREYQVRIDGVLYSTGNWNNGTQLVVDVDTSRPAGFAYNYTIFFNYTGPAGVQTGTQDSVFIYIRSASFQTFSASTTNQTNRFATFGLTLSVQANVTMNLYVDRNNNTNSLLYQIQGKPGNANGLNVRVVHSELPSFKLNYSMTIEYSDALLGSLGIDDARIDPYLWNDVTQQWMDLRIIAKSYSINRLSNVIYLAMPDNTMLVGEFIFIGTPELTVSTNSTFFTSAQSVQISTTWTNINNAALSLEIKNPGSVILYSNASWGITDVNGNYVRSLKISAIPGLDNNIFSIHVTANNITHTKTNQYYLTYFVVDSVAPAITITSPANNTYHSVAFTLNTQIVDLNLNAASIKYYADHSTNQAFSGNGTFNLFASLSYGWHNVSVEAFDMAGNRGYRTIRIFKDDVKPIITLNSPVANGTYRNGVFWINTTVTETYLNNMYYRIDSSTNGTYSFTGNATINLAAFNGIGQGFHYVIVYATDTAGNVGWRNLTFYKDTILPTVQITSPSSGAVVRVPFMINTRLIDTYPNITSMYYKIDSPLNTTVYSFTGNASINAALFTILSEGTHIIYMYGRDLAGNTNSASIDFVKDTISPVVTILSPLPNKFLNATFTVAGLNTDPHADDMWFTINTTLVTGLMPFSGSNWSTIIALASFNALADGSYNLTVHANDTAGNTNRAWLLFTKDTVLPSMTVISPATNNTYVNAAFTISVNVVDTNYDKTWYRVDGGVANYFEGSTLISGFGSLSEGAHLLRIYASDKAANVKSVVIGFTKDTGVPIIVINNPTSSSFFNQTFLIDVTSTDTNLDKQWYIVDDVLSTKTVFDGSEMITSVIFNSLGESSHTVKIYANDSAGNQAFTSFTFTKDTVLPVLTRVLPVANNGYYKAPFNYHITVIEKDLDASYYLIDTLVGSGTSFAENATQSFTDFNTLSEGSHTVYFIARDFAGNVQYISLTFTRDITSPTVQLTSPSNGTAFNIAFNFVVTVFDKNYANATFQVNTLTIRSFTANLSTAIDAGDWSTLVDGTHQVKFTATDLAGNTRIMYLLIVKDTTAPTLTLLLPGNNTYHSAAFMLSVRAQDPRFSKVWYRIGAGSYVYAYDGNQTIIEFSALSEGLHSVQVFANDTLGNTRFIFLAFTKDTILPTVSIANPANNTQFKAAVSFLAFVGDVNFNATSYRVDSGTTRVFTRNVTTIIDSGDWASLSQGAHQITITAVDRAGNTKIGTINFIKDTIAPIFSNISPGNNTFFRVAFNFSAFVFEVNFNNVSYQIDLGNTRYFPRNATTQVNTLDWDPLSQAFHAMKISAADVAGNVRIGWIYFTKDTIKPVISLNSPINNTYFNTNFTITTTTTDTNLLAKWYNVDSGTNMTYTTSIVLSFATLSQGLHIVRIFANDSAGNVERIIFQFTKDTVLPVINILSPGQNTIFRTTFLMSTLVVDANYNNTYYRIDSYVNGTYAFNGNQTIDTTAFNAIGQGTHSVHIYAVDRAGNVNNVTLNFIKDTIAPVVTIQSPVNGTAFAAVFQFRVNVYDVNFNSLTYRIDALATRSFNRNLSVAINSSDWDSLLQGGHQMNITAIDVPGNRKTVFLAFTKDTNGPVVTFNQVTNQTPCLIGITNFVEKGDNVTLRIRVQDSYSNISKVQMFVNITGTSIASTMVNQGGGIYQYMIAGLSYQGITVAYYFRTNDTLNNVVTTSTYTYFIVYDKEKPVVAVNNAVTFASSKQAGTTQTFQTTLMNYNATSAMTVIYAVQAMRPDGVVMNLVYNASVVVSAGGTTFATLNLLLPTGVTGTYTCTIQLKTGWIAAGGYTTWVKTVTFTAIP